MSSKLYEYAVIHTATVTKEQADRGEKPKSTLIVPVTHILAGSDTEARMLAARAIPADYADRLDQVEIALRPF